VQRLAGPQRFECCLVEFPGEFLKADAGIWQECLAHLALGRRERSTFRNLGRSEQRSREWLLGRLAAKDAIRRLINVHHGEQPYPADIEIENDDFGQPHARIRSSPPREPVALSIAHCGNTAVAIACHSGPAVGIDLERLGSLGADVDYVAFTAAERDQITAADPSRHQEWLLRLWCSKEAAGKAVGGNCAGRPTSFTVQEVDLHSGDVYLTAAPELIRDYPIEFRRPVKASTYCESALVLAVVVIERNP